MPPKSKCVHCSRRVSKLSMIPCDACKTLFCTGCLQPEVHDCGKQNVKVGTQVQALQATMERVQHDRGLKVR